MLNDLPSQDEQTDGPCHYTHQHVSDRRHRTVRLFLVADRFLEDGARHGKKRFTQDLDQEFK